MKIKTFMILLVMLLCVQTISAELFQFDNVKSYDENTKTITITNTFGLGGDIAKIKLETPLINYVGVGKNIKVAEFQVTSLKDYSNAFEKMEFYNSFDLSKEIQRTFEYKVKSYEDILVNDYKEVCGLSKNGTNECNLVVSGSHTEQKEVWTPLEKADFTDGQITTIGIFTTTHEGDRVEWILNAYGVRLNEFAGWVASLNSGLKIYWTLDNSGNILYDSLGVVNSTITNVENVTGIQKSSRGFGGAGNISFSANMGSVLPTGTNPISISLWVYANMTYGSNTEYIFCYGKGALNVNFCIYLHNAGHLFWSGLGAGQDVNSTYLMPSNTWTNIVMNKINSTAVDIYINGELKLNGVCAGVSITTPNRLVLGIDSYDSADNTRWNGKIDEVGIWNRTLTQDEITALYNGGAGISYTNLNPAVVLNSPIAYYNSTTASVTFNASVLEYNDGGVITNVTLYIDGVVNETNTTGLNGTYIFTKTLSEATHNWSILAYNSNSKSNQSATRNFTIDLTKPTITIHYPLNTTYYTNYTTEDNTTLWFNWTAIDTHLDKCVWYNTTANTTITCNANASAFFTFGQRTFIAYANDTFNWSNSSRITATWLYNVLENSRTIPEIATEGSTQSFTLNLTAVPPVTSAYLNYNGTRKSVTISAGTYTILNSTFAIPLVSGDGNVTLLWEVNVGGGYFNTTSNTTNITDIAVDNCTLNHVPIFNFTMVNESTQLEFNESAVDLNANLNLQVYSNDLLTSIINFSTWNNDSNPFAVCINDSLIAGEQYKVDVEVEYWVAGYNHEYYHIQQQTLTSTYSNALQNITLYDLLTTDATIFKIIYRDDTYAPVTNAIIQIKRKYVDEGVFKITEIPLTDFNGETLASFEVDDVIYSFTIIKNGEILDNFNNLFVKCGNSLTEICTINLNSVADYVSTDDYTTGDDFIFDIGFNRTTKVVTAVFSIPSGNSSTIILNTTLTNNTAVVCSDTLVSSSGILTCVVPAGLGNQTITAYMYKDGTLQGYSNIDMRQKAKDIYGNNLFFLLIFLYLTIIGVAIGDNPMVTGVFLFIGAVIGIAINLVNGTFIGRGATILWLLIAIVIVLIKGGKRT